VRARTGHGHDPAGFAFKAGDGLYGTFECRTVDTMLVFGSNAHGTGRVYSVPVAVLPNARGDGRPITSLIELEAGTQPLHYFAANAETTLLLANTGGYGLLARVGDMQSRQKGGKSFLSVDDADRLLPPMPLAAGHRYVAALSLSGRLLVFALDELKLQSNGGKGLTLMDVDAKDPLVSVAPFAQAIRVIGTGRGAKPKEEDLKGVALAAHQGKRARKGKAIEGSMKAQRVIALG
jgi:topoisomerase-4 subunit A